MLLSAFAVGAYGQDPTTSAPAPQHSADMVKSAFSDAYSAFTKWDRQHGATMETITINGDDKVLKFSGDYVAVSLGGRKLNDMEYMHADVYAPATGGVSQVRFGFAMFSGGEKYANDYNTDTPAGQWTSIDIPLSAFSGYDFSNAQVFRMTMTKTPGNTFYMDNVYFYTTKEPANTLPTVAAPTPKQDAANVRSCYSDAYTSYYEFNGYNSNGCQVNSKEIAPGEHVLEVKDFRWIHFALGQEAGVTTVDLSGMERLHFDVYVPADNVTTSIQPGMFNVAGKKEAFSGKQELNAGKWVSVDLKMQDFQNVGLTAVNNITFKDPANKTGLIYLDNVYFYNGDPIAPDPVDPDPVDPDVFSINPAPTPANAASTVKSIYSDAYTSVGEFTNAGGNSGIKEEEITIADGDKARKLTGYEWVKYTIGSVDVSDMTYLHVDIATPDGSDACTSVQPILVNGSTSYYTGSPELAKGKWTSLNIKLADYTAKGLDATAVSEIRFKHSGKGSIVIDNVYFCTEEGAKGNTDAGWGSTGGDDPVIDDVPLAPVPTRDAADVKAFFSDAYSTLFGKFEVATYGEGKVEILDVADNQQVCKITSFNWVPINLGQRDVSDKGYVHFDFYTPANDAVASINVGFHNWNASDGSAFEISGEDYNYRALVPGQWNSFDIPLSNFHDFDFSKQMAVLRLRKGGTGKTLYVDNVYFWGVPGDPGDPGDPDEKNIQDSTDGELPDMNTPMLGVNLSSASGGSVPGSFGYDYMYPRLEDLYYFKAKGARLIRLPFRAARFIEDIKNPVADYDKENKSDVAAMKAVVAEAERLGMWVFLDAHDYAERTIDGTQYKLGEGEYTIERFAKMWGAIANEFKDYKNIWGYDLQNEPKVTAQVLVEAYQAAIDEIRKVDTNAQIIVEGTNWASAYEWIYGDHADKQYPGYSTEVQWSYKENSPWLLAGLKDPQNKIVFQAHGYFDKDNSGTYKSGFNEVDYRKRFMPFLEWCRTNNAKGLIGEFGVPYNGHSTGDERYMDILDGALQLFRDYGVNATYWCAGAMYEANSLTCQPDKSALGNYLPSKEKSTMKVLEKYFTDWAENSGDSGIRNVNEASVVYDSLTYNVMGIEVDENYKGVVIRNGKKFIQK